MAPGDMTASTPVYVDSGDDTKIKAEVEKLNLANSTDRCCLIPVANGQQVMIMKLEREA